jgi:UDPglucose 6-dehydrogenase
LHRLEQLVSPLAGKTVAMLGLSYKPGTDALRRSVAIELCHALKARGAKVQAFDPAVKAVPAALADTVHLTAAPIEALRGATAAILATDWPEFRKLSADDMVEAMARPLVLDASRFLARQLQGDQRLEYLTVGATI